MGQTPSQAFTLSNTGGRSSGTIAVSLSGSAAFTITADGCTAKALGPNKSCSVTVQYAPINTNGDTGTLTATGEHASTGMNLYGNGSANLVLSPGTFVSTSSCGAKNYDYANNFVPGNWSTTFTVTNTGTGTSNMLSMAGCCHAQFTLSNDTCSGNTLAPGGSCTFDLTFTTPSGCNPGDEFHTPLAVEVQDNGCPYIFLVAHGFCPP